MAGNSVVGAGGGDDGRETQDMANYVTTTDNPGVLDLFRGVITSYSIHYTKLYENRYPNPNAMSE